MKIAELSRKCCVHMEVGDKITVLGVPLAFLGRRKVDCHALKINERDRLECGREKFVAFEVLLQDLEIDQRWRGAEIKSDEKRKNGHPNLKEVIISRVGVLEITSASKSAKMRYFWADETVCAWIVKITPKK